MVDVSAWTLEIFQAEGTCENLSVAPPALLK